MRLVLIGYGRMGREIERLSRERGHAIVARYTASQPLPGNSTLAALADTSECFIDFSVASAVIGHVRSLAPFRLPLVIGTTGWDRERGEVLRLVEKAGGALIHAPNFSPGAALFFRLVEEAAALLAPFPDFDIAVHETHHRLKADAPSGTALTIAERILSSLPRKTAIVNGEAHFEPQELQVTSSRVGNVTGTHTVLISTPAETITLTHEASNRSGYALGALMAAEWLNGRTGVFTFDDVLSDILHHQS